MPARRKEVDRLTDKELRRLRRTELLAMMIEGKQAVAAAEEKLEEERAERAKVEEQMSQLQETYERLCKKLDDKDQKIRDLKAELASATGTRQALTEEAAEVSELTARLSEAVEAAERARALFEKAAADLKGKPGRKGVSLL